MNTVKSVKRLPNSDGNIEIEFDKPVNARDIPVLTYALYGNNDTNSKYVSIIKNTLFKKDSTQSVGNTLVFSDIHPIDSNLNFYFSSVEISKKIPDGGVREYIEFKLTPELGENASIDNALSQVSSFTISVDRFLNTSNMSNQMLVGYVAQFFDDTIKEQYLKAQRSSGGVKLNYPMNDRDRDAFYDVIGVANKSKSSKYFTFSGKVLNTRNKGTTEESSRVYFNQVIPTNVNITTYNGRINTMRDLIRFTYDSNYGWKRNLVYKKLLDRRYGRQYFNYKTRVMMFRFMRMVFGTAPLLLHKYMRKIVTVRSPRNRKVYQTNNRNSRYIVNSYLPSEQLLPLGNHFDFTQFLNQNSNGVRKLAMGGPRSSSTLLNYNPFLCGAFCAQNDECDMFQQVKNTCSLYEVSDPQVKSFMKNYISPTGGIKSSMGRGLNREQHADLQNKAVNYMKNGAMRSRPEFMSGIDNFSKEDLEAMNKRLVQEKKQSEVIEINLKESFENRDTTGTYLNSAAASLQTALKEAEGYQKTYDLTHSQANYGINQKIYYNLFTTALWIINLACIVAILYVILVGFMGVELSQIAESVSGAVAAAAPAAAAPAAPAAPAAAPASPAY